MREQQKDIPVCTVDDPEARGGTPYGATTITGPKGELQPTPEDLEIDRSLGRRVAGVTAKLRS